MPLCKSAGNYIIDSFQRLIHGRCRPFLSEIGALQTVAAQRGIAASLNALSLQEVEPVALAKGSASGLRRGMAWPAAVRHVAKESPRRTRFHGEMKMNLKPLHRQLALAAIAALALGAGVAHADEVVCNGRIDAVSIDGDVKVPSNVACTLAGTRVDGNVKVESGASLATQNARIGGNVQAENHRQVNLAGGAVGGSVQLKQGGGANIASVSVKGDIQLFENRGAQTVRNNRVDGNLQCKSNSPAPTGGGNIVQGNKEDQCARL